MKIKKGYFEENIGGILAIVGVIGLLLSAFLANNSNTENESCYIKGNISYNNGEKIYHIPGQEFYNQTVPEVCFDSEEEARDAGFRKSLR